MSLHSLGKGGMLVRSTCTRAKLPTSGDPGYGKAKADHCTSFHTIDMPRGIVLQPTTIKEAMPVTTPAIATYQRHAACTWSQPTSVWPPDSARNHNGDFAKHPQTSSIEQASSCGNHPHGEQEHDTARQTSSGITCTQAEGTEFSTRLPLEAPTVRRTQN